MKSKKPNLLIVSILFITLFLSTSIATYAYFVNLQSRGILIESGSFDVIVHAYFDEEEITESNPYYDIESQTILVNAYDETSINYIQKFKLSIEIIPVITARMRIQIQDEWQLTRTFLALDGTPMVPVTESVYHTAKQEGYYPFSLLKTPVTFQPIYQSDGYAYINELLIKNQTYRFDVIVGGDPYPVRANHLYIETCVVKLGMMIEVIQANRFEELWGLDETFFNS